MLQSMGLHWAGGCELAMACDIILASKKAKFGQPEVTLGITPGFSGTQRLPRRVGAKKAKALIFSGRIISADEAKAIGLVSDVYEPDELLDKAKEMAASFSKNALAAVKYSKACIDKGSSAQFTKTHKYICNRYITFMMYKKHFPDA